MWENILRKRMTKHAIKIVDSVLDSEPRSVKEILELMWEEVESRRKDDAYIPVGSSLIPTRGELIKYLREKYNFARFSNSTGKIVSSKNNSSSGYEARYWK